MSACENLQHLLGGYGIKVTPRENDGAQVDAVDANLPPDFDLIGVIENALPTHMVIGGGRRFTIAPKPEMVSVAPHHRK